MSGLITVVGITEAGAAGLSVASLDAIAGADWVFGGERHLELLATTLDQSETYSWSQPLHNSFDKLDLRGQRDVVVLASGDPAWHGIARTLGQRYGHDAIRVLPNLSAFSLAASQLQWPLEQTHCRSLHGHDISQLAVWCYPGAKLLLLTSDGAAPRLIADRLIGLGFGAASCQVLEHLGGARESASGWLSPADVSPRYAALNLFALEIPVGASSAVLGATPGFADAAFAHDGQLTKRSVRAVTLSRLRPVPSQCLWDLGAGCGSVAIEWVRSALAQAPGTPRASLVLACAVERNPNRVAMIEHNSVALGTPQLRVYSSAIGDVLDELPDPDAVFIGGGLTQWRDQSDTRGAEQGLELISRCIDRLAAGGRLVVNAVTLESEAVVLAAASAHGGELERIATSTSQSVGRYTALQPNMAVLQWSWVKPHGSL